MGLSSGIEPSRLIRSVFPFILFTKADDNIADYEQLLIMSLCNANIIANSSFSLWGAFFNTMAKICLVLDLVGLKEAVEAGDQSCRAPRRICWPAVWVVSRLEKPFCPRACKSGKRRNASDSQPATQSCG